jgi:hypothetical protein
MDCVLRLFERAQVNLYLGWDFTRQALNTETGDTMKQAASLCLHCRGITNQDDGNIYLYLLRLLNLIKVNMKQLLREFIYLNFTNEYHSRLFVTLNLKVDRSGCPCPSKDLPQPGRITLQSLRLKAVPKEMNRRNALTAQEPSFLPQYASIASQQG